MGWDVKSKIQIQKNTIRDVVETTKNQILLRTDRDARCCFLQNYCVFKEQLSTHFMLLWESCKNVAKYGLALDFNTESSFYETKISPPEIKDISRYFCDNQ